MNKKNKIKMKYLKKFNESIIEPGGFGIKEFLNELRGQLNHRMSFDEVSNISNEFNIEFVNYDKFYDELPEDQKRTAPKKGEPQAPIFGLINPTTERIRIVYQVPFLDFRLFGHLKHVLEHESIHMGQHSRRNLKFILPDPNNSKLYFEDDDEVMAFSQSIVDLLINMDRSVDIEDAITKLDRNPLFSQIKRSVDEKTLNKYKKYIYLYLERELGTERPKKMIRDEKPGGWFRR